RFLRRVGLARSRVDSNTDGSSGKQREERFHDKPFHSGGRAENEGGNRRRHDRARRENEAEGGGEKRFAYRRLQGLGSQDRERKPDGGDAPSFQADAKGLAAFFQSPLQRAERPAELLGRFIARQT